jgi:hypothetical protein
MKEGPILFNGEMVRAILEGRKTQTRRTMKSQPSRDTRGTMSKVFPANANFDDGRAVYRCPSGKPGDRLWVRETWRPYSWYPNEWTVQFKADNKVSDIAIPDTLKGLDWHDRLIEQLSDECISAGMELDDDGLFQWDGVDNPIKWRPSIHMPRWASRITLEVTDVRVQRVQEISEEDAQAEGVIQSCACSPDQEWNYRGGFLSLWHSIYAKHGFGWDVNPWVWAITFGRVN